MHGRGPRPSSKPASQPATHRGRNATGSAPFARPRAGGGHGWLSRRRRARWCRPNHAASAPTATCRCRRPPPPSGGHGAAAAAAVANRGTSHDGGTKRWVPRNRPQPAPSTRPRTALNARQQPPPTRFASGWSRGAALWWPRRPFASPQVAGGQTAPRTARRRSRRLDVGRMSRQFLYM